jgi:hypothetical protein
MTLKRKYTTVVVNSRLLGLGEIRGLVMGDD